MTLEEKLELRVMKDNPNLDRPTARRAVVEAFDFLKQAKSKSNLVPSKLADLGWHAFILHTMDYEKWCMDNVGKFIHHIPNEKDDLCECQLSCSGCDAHLAPCSSDCYFSDVLSQSGVVGVVP